MISKLKETQPEASSLQGDRIKKLRELTGLSRRAFAKLTGVNASALQAWESGAYKKGIKSSHAKELVKHFKMLGIKTTTQWIVSGSGEPPYQSKDEKEQCSLGALDSTLLYEKVKYFNGIREKNIKLIEAIQFNKVQLCRRLIAEGANLHELRNKELYLYSRREDTALHYAASFAGPMLINLMIELGLDPDVRNRHQDAPLHLACYNKNTKGISALLSHGADINAASREGATPLIWAAYMGDLQACKMLLNKGADLHKADQYGNTALHWASFNDQVRVVELLVKQGANLDTPNKDGKLPIDWALENGRIATLKLILDLSVRNISRK